jgi:hypothetical protein
MDRNELGLELEASAVDWFSSDDPLVTLVIRPWGVDIALVWSIELEFSERRRFSCLPAGRRRQSHSCGMVYLWA